LGVASLGQCPLSGAQLVVGLHLANSQDCDKCNHCRDTHKRQRAPSAAGPVRLLVLAARARWCTDGP
jgi:hypothetical protein